MSTIIVPCRGAWVHITEAKMNNLSKEMEYSMRLLIPKTDEIVVAQINTEIERLIIEKWGTNRPAQIKSPLRDADAEGKKESYMVGHYFMNVRSKTQPGIVGRDAKPMQNPAAECHSGDFYRVSVGLYPYGPPEAPNHGIGAGLNNVQWIRAGESISGRKRAEDEFDAVEEVVENDSMLS